jgi:4-hydroxy-3-methylbut-2-enyl diphosphate reductase
LKIKLAKTAGFCMGVHRAMELVLAEANKKEGTLFTLGPLIHNRQVLELLETKGVRAVENVRELQSGRIVIRAHGIPPQTRREIKATGLRIIDATCPKVARVQSIIRYYSGKGYEAVIVGDRDHAEVVGLMGYCKGPVHTILDAREVDELPAGRRFFAVAQTTQNEKTYQKVVAALTRKDPEAKVFNTICEATRQRQEEVRYLAAGQADAVVVVGGYHSGNTQRLVQISHQAGLPALHVETEKDLPKDTLSRMQIIGVTAGASTPNWMIKNVVRELEAIQSRREPHFMRILRRMLRFFILSNLAVAAGALSLCYAAFILSGMQTNPAFPLLAFLYIYAMHVLNRFLDKGASAYNDPDMAAFLGKHRRLLILSGTSAILVALVLSWSISWRILLALGALSLLGIIYSVPLLPAGLRQRYRFAKIKDLPGSRSLSESLAWVAVISILPWLQEGIPVWPAAIVTAALVFLLVFGRSVLLDIFQVQGNLIVGTETLPIFLGEKRTLRIIRGALLLGAAVLLGALLLGVVGTFGYLLLLCPAAQGICLLAYERRWLLPGARFEGLVEANFLLAGVLALFWQLL